MELEFEMKAPLDEGVRRRLDELALVFNSPSIQEDVYYDLSDGSLYRIGIFLRLRNHSRMELKYTADPKDISHSHSVEHGYPWPLSRPSEQQLLSLLGQLTQQDWDLASLQPFITVRKERSIAHWGSVAIALDHVEGLGDFVEIEVTDSADALELQGLQAALQIDNIPVGYAELVTRQRNFPLYIQGRFVLPEDLIVAESLLA